MNVHHAHSRRRTALISLVVPILLGLTASCAERPGTVTAPEAQHSVVSLTTVRFIVRRGPGQPVANATVSVYLDAVSTPTWLTTDATGRAEIAVPTGASVGYLVRLLPPEWLNLTTKILPPVDPGPFTVPAYDDLGAVTCGSSGPVPFTPALHAACVNNRYVTASGALKGVELVLPTIGDRPVTVKGLDGATLSNVHAYLIEELPQPFPWQNLPSGVRPGFLRFFGVTNPTVDLPTAAGSVEVYGRIPTAGGLIEVAGTKGVTAGNGPVTVEVSPVICANPAQADVVYSVSRPVMSPVFTFTEARWAFAARRGTTSALTKDLTTTALVLQFVQAGTTRVIIQHQHTVTETYTARVVVTCTNGVCAIANAIYQASAGSPLRAQLYQPRPGKLFLVVTGHDPSGTTRWKALTDGPLSNDRLPSGLDGDDYFIYSKAFLFCDPDFSFDASYGCDI